MILTWTVEDQIHQYSNLYSIVGNIYTSEKGSDKRDIKITEASEGVSYGTEPFTPDNIAEISYETGSLLEGYSFKVNPDIDSSVHSGSVAVDILENRVGTLSFYLTAYDDAGNMVTSLVSFNLGDWLVTDGGLAYSKEGSSYIGRKLEDSGNVL